MESRSVKIYEAHPANIRLCTVPNATEIITCIHFSWEKYEKRLNFLLVCCRIFRHKAVGAVPGFTTREIQVLEKYCSAKKIKQLKRLKVELTEENDISSSYLFSYQQKKKKKKKKKIMRDHTHNVTLTFKLRNREIEFR